MKTIVFAACLLGACAPPPGDILPAGKCEIRDATAFVNRPFTASLAKRALRMSGARLLRVIRNGQAVTMDYREDRLNIPVDIRNHVTGLSCG